MSKFTAKGVARLHPSPGDVRLEVSLCSVPGGIARIDPELANVTGKLLSRVHKRVLPVGYPMARKRSGLTCGSSLESPLEERW